MSIAGAAVLTFLGTFEGYAFYRCGMYAPAALFGQMNFQRFIVMKVFFSAVGSSMITQSIMSVTHPKEFEASRFYKNNTVGFTRSVGGCFILGVGMAIAGSGPTLIPTQLVAVSQGYLLLAGALLGGAIFALAEPFLPSPVAAPLSPITLDEKNSTSYAAVAVPLGAALLLATIGLELVFPQSVEAAGLGVGPLPTLLPIVAGCVIGLNQIPLRFLQKSGQGGSMAIMRMVSTLSCGMLSPKTRVNGIASMYQFFYVYVGGVIGAYFAMVQAGPTAVLAPRFSDVRTVFGAATMIIGARIAHGCTCGHGITGFSELSVVSIASAMAIFAGGIATAVLCF